MNENNLMPFTFDDNLVRVHVDETGNPWFAAKDIAAALGYSESSLETPGKLFQHIPEEWTNRKRIPVSSENGIVQDREILCLSEQGLYFFLGRSDKPRALPFQKWLAGDALPSIRQTGQYAMPGARGGEAFTTGRDRTQLRNMVDAWSKTLNCDEHLLWAVIRAHFNLRRINEITVGQIGAVQNFVKQELISALNNPKKYAIPIARRVLPVTRA